MRGRGRVLALAVALQVGLVSAAAAQTVVVRRAPVGTAVEVVVNMAVAGKGTADARGDAVVPIDLREAIGKPEAGMNVLIDVCDNLRRVTLLERGVRPLPAEAGCERREAIGLFLVRPISTVVVFVEGVSPRVLLIQGRYSLDDPRPGTLWQGAPSGLTLSAGGGLRTYREFRVAACGNVQECSGGGAGLGYTAGAAFWILPYVGAEVAFVAPADGEVSGSGQGFEFDSTFDVQAVSIAGLGGVPIGPVRLYGKAGRIYHRATFSTTQTNEARSVTVDGVEQTIPAATQTFALRTAGWGWSFGGGSEIWISRRAGIFAEFARHSLRGPAEDDADGEIDEALTTVFVGVKFSLWR